MLEKFFLDLNNIDSFNSVFFDQFVGNISRSFLDNLGI
jgi:hypothetical protein